MSTNLPKYQSPKRKRSNSSENSKKPRDQDLSFQIQFKTPVNGSSHSSFHLDKYALPEGLGLGCRLDWHEPSKSGNTTLADQSREVTDVSLFEEQTSVVPSHLASLNSSSSSTATRVACSDRMTLCRDIDGDMSGLRSQSILLRSPTKINRQFIPFKSTLSKNVESMGRLGCSCGGCAQCSVCNKWRTTPEDEDCSDDENTANVQLHMNFSDEEDAHSREDAHSDNDASLVAGPTGMSSLNVSRRRRPCLAERTIEFLSRPPSSPDLFSGDAYRDSPISRFSSPDLGYVGTPVLEIESSADLDEALLLDSSISACLSSLTSTSRREREPESSADVGTRAEEVRRPALPTQAFERKVFRSPSFVNKQCPATPLRGPNPHAQLQQDELSRGGSNSLARQNSLVTNKVLLSQSEVSEGSDVSFHRDFEDEGVLGAGQFSTVYLGRAKDGTNRVCAIKKLNSQFRNRKERDFHLKEVRIMERIGKTPCEFVIHFFTAWQEEGHLYVDIEFAANGTLKDLINNQTHRDVRFEEPTIWCVVHDVAAGLQHIHDCGFVHLDIKPANILIAESGVMKIADFGCAVEAGVDSDGSEGDTRYMAAELLDSNIKLPSADVFSLGVTVYEVCMNLQISGLPLEGLEWHNLREERAPRIPGRSDALVGAVTAMMRAHVERRIGTAAILALPEVATAKSCEDALLTTCKPDRPLFSKLSFSLPSINTQQDQRSIDEERVVTPREGSSVVNSLLLHPVKTPVDRQSIAHTIENRSALFTKN